MSEPEVERYVTELFAPEDAVLAAVRASHRESDLPGIHISPQEGKIIHVLLRAIGARRVLKVGTLGGYSAIWIVRALPADGSLITIEGSEKHAAFALDAFESAGVADRVELIRSEALDTMRALTGPFDAIFLDADKAPLPRYYAEAMRLLRVGGLLLCDNTFLDGRITRASDMSSDVQGMREFNRLAATDARLTAAVVPVRDGLMVAVKVTD